MFFVLVVYPDGWYLQENYLYKYFPGKRIWQKAKKFCESIDAELAYIPNQELNNFVYRNLLQRHVNPRIGRFIELNVFQYRNFSKLENKRKSCICHASCIPLKIAGCNTTGDMIGCWLLDSSDPDVMYVQC